MQLGFLFMVISDNQFYERLCKRELSNEEVFEAKSNFVGFFDLLVRIDKRLNENDLKDNFNSNDSDKKV